MAEPVEVPVRETPITSSPCHILIGTDTELIAEDATGDERIADLAVIGQQGVGAWAGYPIRSRDGHVLGALCVVDDHPRPFTPAERRGLATLARAVTALIASRQDLDAAEVEITRLEESADRSHATAIALQESLLPPVLDCPLWLDAAAAYLPAAGEGVQVLGDFFDLFPTIDGCWLGIVGDVAGHGLEAAQVTALARYTVRTEATQHSSPATVLHRLNQALNAQRLNHRFLTAVCLTLRPAPPAAVTAIGRPPATMHGEISHGGHPPALLRRADGTVAPLGGQGALLGVLDDITLTTQHFALHPGDLLLLYTDGATELRDPHDVLLQTEGLARLLADIPGAGPQANAQTVLRSLIDALIRYTGKPADDQGRFRTDDDTALLILRAPALHHPQTV